MKRAKVQQAGNESLVNGGFSNNKRNAKVT
jgi:hypothetical protein